jgi:hypothetical protein
MPAFFSSLNAEICLTFFLILQKSGLAFNFPLIPSVFGFRAAIVCCFKGGIEIGLGKYAG